MALNAKQQRVVDILERSVELCREFMNDWLRFNQVLSAYPSPGANKAQLESEFLKIKSKLARSHQVLRETLQADYRIDSNLMNIVSGATNLESIYTQSEIAVRKLQNEWHRAFISINENLGLIEDKKTRAEKGEKMFVGGAGPVAGGGGMNAAQKKNLTIAVIAIVVVAAAIFVKPIRDVYWSSLVSFFPGLGK